MEDKYFRLYKIIFILGIIVILGNLFDALATYISLTNINNYEANFLPKYILVQYGWVTFFLIKIILITVVFLQVKYSPLYFFLNFITRIRNTRLKNFYFILTIILELLSATYFWSLVILNLLVIF